MSLLLAQRLVSRQSLKNHMHTSTKKSIILFNNCIVCSEFAICEMEQVEKLVERWVLPLSFTCSALSSCSTPAAQGGGLWLPPKSHPMQPGQHVGLCLCLRPGFSAPSGAPESPASPAPAASLEPGPAEATCSGTGALRHPPGVRGGDGGELTSINP